VFAIPYRNVVDAVQRTLGAIRQPAVATASPYPLDRTADLTRAEFAALRRRTIFFDGVFKGSYSLAIVNRYLARELLKLGLKVTCYTPERDWQQDAMLQEMPDVHGAMTSIYPGTGTFDLHLRNTWPPEAGDMVGKRNAFVCFAWEEIDVPSQIVELF
jgi:hypothetical protein